MSNKAHIREAVKNLTLFDDDLFRKAAEDEGFCEEIVGVFLDDPELKVIGHQQQRDVKNLQGRSVNLDLLCKLSNEKTVNVEVQKSTECKIFHYRRVRYNSSCITANITDPGTDFKKVPEVIVVYVTPFDIFGDGQLKYVSRSTVCSTGRIIDDGLTNIYINASVYDESRLAKLMKVFTGDKEFRKDFPKTNEILIRYTEEPEGVEMMTEVMEKIWGEEARQIKKEGIEEGKNQIISKLEDMLQKGCNIDDIKDLVSKNIDCKELY